MQKNKVAVLHAYAQNTSVDYHYNVPPDDNYLRLRCCIEQKLYVNSNQVDDVIELMERERSITHFAA